MDLYFFSSSFSQFRSSFLLFMDQWIQSMNCLKTIDQILLSRDMQHTYIVHQKGVKLSKHKCLLLQLVPVDACINVTLHRVHVRYALLPALFLELKTHHFSDCFTPPQSPQFASLEL